jgi:hypothetical protein
MKTQDLGEKRRVLRAVIYLAHEGGYDGPGADWDSASSKELDQVLESGAHVPVLRSANFARSFFWHVLFPDAVTVSPGAAVDEVPADETEEIEAQVAALSEQLAEAKDALTYLSKFLT